MCELAIRVLVVDDNDFARNVISQALGVFFENILVETVENLGGALALDLDGFDLIITDLTLFGGSGLEILYCIRLHGLQTPFVVMTGFTTEEVLKEINSDTPIGNFEILLKPFNIMKLRDLVLALTVTTPALCK